MIAIRETEQFKTWIQRINDRVTQAVINARIRRISAGNFGYGPGFRVYFTRLRLEMIVLLCGGDKSTQSRDIVTAKQIAQNLEEV